MSASLTTLFLSVFLIAHVSPAEAATAGLPLADMLSSAHCKDYEIRQLVSKGQHFKCFIEEEGVTEETKECTISGKCQAVSVRESAIAKGIDRWAIFWVQAIETIRTTRVVFEDAAFTLMPNFIRERAVWSDASNNIFGRSASDRTTTTPDAPPRVAEAELGTYEKYIKDRSVIEKMCESAPVVPGVFSFLIPLFPESTACRPRGAVYAKNSTVKNTSAPIWITADPVIVGLGERATLSWGAGQDVVALTCAVLGPGLKTQSVSGSAVTVPVTKATTFTFTCMRLDGATTSVSTTIDLAV